MQSKRPTSVLVIAIFHFLFGGLGLIGGLIGIGSGIYALIQPATPPGYKVASYPPDVMESMKYMDSNVPGWRVVTLTSAVLGLGLTVALLAAGLGLVHMKPWARALSIAYAVFSILYQGIFMVYTFLYVTPAQMALYDNMPPPAGVNAAQAQSVASMGKMIAGCSPVFALIGLVYPVIVLIVMLLPSVKAAFRGAPAGAEDEAGGDDLPRAEAGYGDLPPGYGGEPDDRIGPAPR